MKPGNGNPSLFEGLPFFMPGFFARPGLSNSH
jgi:hypothetical protein